MTWPFTKKTYSESETVEPPTIKTIKLEHYHDEFKRAEILLEIQNVIMDGAQYDRIRGKIAEALILYRKLDDQAKTKRLDLIE